MSNTVIHLHKSHNSRKLLKVHDIILQRLKTNYQNRQAELLQSLKQNGADENCLFIMAHRVDVVFDNSYEDFRKMDSLTKMAYQYRRQEELFQQINQRLTTQSLQPTQPTNQKSLDYLLDELKVDLPKERKSIDEQVWLIGSPVVEVMMIWHCVGYLVVYWLDPYHENLYLGRFEIVFLLSVIMPFYFWLRVLFRSASQKSRIPYVSIALVMAVGFWAMVLPPYVQDIHSEQQASDSNIININNNKNATREIVSDDFVIDECHYRRWSRPCLYIPEINRFYQPKDSEHIQQITSVRFKYYPNTGHIDRVRVQMKDSEEASPSHNK